MWKSVHTNAIKNKLCIQYMHVLAISKAVCIHAMHTTNSMQSTATTPNSCRDHPSVHITCVAIRFAYYNRLADPVQTTMPDSGAMPQSPEGCYLSYHSDSGGRLEMHYSRTPIEGACGFWAPGEGKKIQGFKYNGPTRRQNLITGIAGGDANRKKYFSGWCQFVKEAKKFNGWVTKIPDMGGVEVDVYAFYLEGSRMEMLKLDGGLVHVGGVDAVTCVPRDSDVYKGVKNIDIGSFVNTGKGDSIAMS